MERPALLGTIITDRPTDQTNNQPTHQQINREGNEWSSHVTQKKKGAFTRRCLFGAERDSGRQSSEEV